MIYVTGDTHADFSRFSTDAFPEQKQMTKDDYVIVCGDFGIWDGSREEDYKMKWLNSKPFTTLFVTGNHSNYDLLGRYSIEEWHGGKVQVIQPSVIHLMRGQVYDIENMRFFTMGGASSHDIQDGILDKTDPEYKEKKKRLDAKNAMYRVNHISWWKEELPSEQEYQTALETLERCNWSVDYIITHCCPSSIEDEFSGGFYSHDALTGFFDGIKDRCKFKNWIFGHYHENKRINEQFVMLYEQIIRLPEVKEQYE